MSLRVGAIERGVSAAGSQGAARAVAALVAAMLVLSGCDESDERDVDTSKPHGAQFGFQTDIATSLVEEGRIAYQQYCVGCHGTSGDGNGEAAVFLDPKPRNFVLANFKFSSTRSGQLPTDADLKRTLRNGLRGSAMPPFNLLPERTLDGLVAYIKTFSPKWSERSPAAAIPVVEDPFRDAADKTEAIRRGEAVYHGFVTCWSCHPSYVEESKINDYLEQFGSARREGFRPDLHLAVGKPNSEGQLIYPPDFLRDYVRAGASVDDLYRSIAAGITGTAMPTWIDSIDVPAESPDQPPIVSRADLWAAAYYVRDLIAKRPPLLAEGKFDLRERPSPIYLHGAPPPATAPAEEAEEAPEIELDE